MVTGMSKNMFENNSKIPAGVDLLIFPSHSLPRHLSERTRIRVERHQRRLCAPVSAQTRAAKAGAKVAGGKGGVAVPLKQHACTFTGTRTDY